MFYSAQVAYESLVIGKSFLRTEVMELSVSAWYVFLIELFTVLGVEEFITSQASMINSIQSSKFMHMSMVLRLRGRFSLAFST